MVHVNIRVRLLKHALKSAEHFFPMRRVDDEGFPAVGGTAGYREKNNTKYKYEIYLHKIACVT